MVKVKAIMSFNDLEANKHRNIGDVFEVSDERADYLVEHNGVEVVLEEKEDVIKEAVEDEIKEEEKEYKKDKKKKRK